MNTEQKEREEEEKREERKRLEEEEKQKKKEEELAGLTHHTDQWGHPYSQKGTKKITAFYDDIWCLDPTSHEMRNEWEDRVAVTTMRGRAYINLFLGRRVVDTPEHSLFSLIGFKHHYYVPSNVEGELPRSVEAIDYFPSPITVQISKTKSGKYRENKTKQLKVSEKVDLKDFPKVNA
jgi:hypothetical protein